MPSKKMNLLPISYQRQYEVDTKAFLRKALVSLFVVFFIAFLFLGKYQLYALEQDIDTLEIQRSQLTERSAAITAISVELEQLESQWKQYDHLGIKTIRMNTFLDDIKRSTPTDVWYSSIELYGDESTEVESIDAIVEPNTSQQDILHFSIHGYSQTIRSAGNLTYLLNQLPYMNQVVIEYSSEVMVNGVPIIEFHVSGQILH